VSLAHGQGCAQRRPRSTGRNKAKEGKKAQGKGGARESNVPPRFDFVVELAELIAVPAIAARLRAPEKTDRVLGRKKNVWCEFHQAYGHSLHSCLALGHQLAELVKSGFLSDYLQETQGDRASGPPAEDPQHEVPVHGRCTRSRGASLEEGVQPLRGRGTLGR